MVLPVTRELVHQPYRDKGLFRRRQGLTPKTENRGSAASRYVEDRGGTDRRADALTDLVSREHP